jgi:tetratricopeptide (TPR) repeat protein
MIAVAAVGIIGAGWTLPAAAQGACTGGGKISKTIAKPMAAAQDAQKARRWQDMLAKVREAEQTPGAKTQTDLYYMAEFRGYAYHQLRQYADAARELEAGLNSPCMPESQRADRYKSLVGLYTNLRNYPKAIDFGNRALKISRDPDIQVAVAQAYYQSGDNKSAVRVMNELIESSGRPKEQQLLLVLSACQKAGDNNCVAKVYEKLVLNYPKAEYWSNLMDALRKSDLDDLQRINVMRLALHVNVLKRPDEFKEFAQLALEEKLAADAKSVLEQGFTKKVFVEQRDIDVNKRLLKFAETQAAAEKAALPAQETAAKSAATGDALVKVGAQNLAFGDNAKAISLISAGIAKGNLRKGDPKEKARIDEASLLLGIAHLRNNNKAEAAKAFRSVKNDPTMVRIAKLWLLNT